MIKESLQEQQLKQKKLTYHQSLCVVAHGFNFNLWGVNDEKRF